MWVYEPSLVDIGHGYDAADNMTARRDAIDPTNFKEFCMYDVWNRSSNVGRRPKDESAVWTTVAECICEGLPHRPGKENLASGTVAGLDRRLYALHDANRSVVAASKTSGVVQERCTYTAYGNAECRNRSTSLTLQSSSAALQTVLYADQDLDVETGFQINRNRYCHPHLGRFLSRDPIESDLNLYRYVSNAPIDRLDPTGLAGDDQYAVTREEVGTTLQANGASQTKWSLKLKKASDKPLVVMQHINVDAEISTAGGKRKAGFTQDYWEVVGVIAPNGDTITIPGTVANLAVIAKANKGKKNGEDVVLPPNTELQLAGQPVPDDWFFSGTQNPTCGQLTQKGRLAVYELTPEFLKWTPRNDTSTPKAKTGLGWWPPNTVYAQNPTPPAGAGGFATGLVPTKNKPLWTSNLTVQPTNWRPNQSTERKVITQK